MFIKNAWYVAAWDHEVTDEVPFGRTILNEPVVLYRTKEGKVAAVEDRCCHRIYPLSKGRMNEGRIQCGYHGMIFDETGACVDVPWQKNVPKKAKVRAYPVVEQAHWIWIWMGDPALANPDEITDFHWLDDPDWGAKGTVFHVKCDYKLIVENLLDLTHLAYVHQTTIGNDAVAEGAETKYDRTEEDVTVTRWVIDAPAPPTYVKAGGFDKNVDRWQIINFTPPSSIRLDVGACDTGTGAPEGKRVGGINMRNLNGITPETETTTHYFWAQAHNFNVDNPDVTELVYQQVHAAFSEDIEVFEEQQALIDREPQAPRINLSGDVGGLAAVEIIDKLVAEENQSMAAE
ncbi:MAG: aromatic ring-hydroxylating dioxygenase subunit alpha [Rhodospirillaceae bacterium]|jgi:phenylpropionate dioxygenase-like ring-hydroxylating dioxygenase large terminal subunit|nr:aromatic ring-hydroxylating dioxygenase subunit alpha [Rhodospirillaceae bacterium]MBT4588649.1 aromatic ring-hydroxylating dioxygenase subunit alpha [Rhodospirillaceae bacterium]MBT4937513.1 aromatic ring-hydroxylating dioxygenase subunit alpha [Rhodospirillaceae bacterium]MBT5939904.1 aromatic ring-hydroxylating dioxygenase subunit alpha [Rhodospirillaceae bacterium]MBT7266109.1 aromatic ring-hydroxylating dioxygenase subunit alpha [Rhodospirillaceae bacterium]